MASSGVRVLPRLGAVLLAGLVVGAATSFLQTVLPQSIAPLANSGTPWALVGMAVVWLSRVTGWTATGFGVGTLILEVLGYYGTAALRGYPAGVDSVVFWLVVAVIVGALVGVAAAWLRDASRVRRVAGVALPAVILLVEGAYLAYGVGRPEFRDYGIGSMVLGVALALAGGALAARRAAPVH